MKYVPSNYSFLLQLILFMQKKNITNRRNQEILSSFSLLLIDSLFKAYNTLLLNKIQVFSGKGINRISVCHTSYPGFLISLVRYTLFWGVMGIRIKVLWQLWELNTLVFVYNPVNGRSSEIQLQDSS